MARRFRVKRAKSASIQHRKRHTNKQTAPDKPTDGANPTASKLDTTAPGTAPKRTASQYDDPSHDYLHYWQGREYENAAEKVAIERLLKCKRFKHAVDIGGGYGRLCVLLEYYADRVTLAEPSQQQLDLAKDFLRGHPRTDCKRMQVEDLKFPDGSVDLIVMIRVMHHLPEPETPFAELARTLSDDGYIILEMANYTHFRNRLKHLLKGKKMPDEPVDIRSSDHRKVDNVPFVNHNPRTVIKQLSHAGLLVENTLSVSNLRSSGLKKVMPSSLMIALERFLQAPLASTYFGPSIFFLIRKASSN